MVLNEFLTEHPDVMDDIEELLQVGLWTSAAIIIDRSSNNAKAAAEFLEKMPGDWPATCSSFILKAMESNEYWYGLDEKNAGAVLDRMAKFVVGLRSLHQIKTIADIAYNQAERCSQKATILHTFASCLFLRGVPNEWNPRPASVPVATGPNLIAVITKEGNAAYWGEYSASTLKMDRFTVNMNVTSIKPPRIFDALDQLCSIACGTEHLLGLTAHGKVYSVGANRYGQCGVGHKNKVESAVEIVGNYGCAKMITAGQYHSALVNEQGQAFTWGWSFYGQLGNGSVFEDVTEPYFVKFFT
ncbi:unnamed protein product [Gongylonema pulchrum]|uniref:Regulator of chromosome condensation (RCC1) family protein n=1 Tax=Gongylonema pulchrum TaxID=637853 RepID=A0A183E8G4_9BILA|nr:unnamed protein product [Gongylonema pulchrum]